MKGMPFSYNEAVRLHPDMKEFVEKCWSAQCRKSDRISDLEAAMVQIEGKINRASVESIDDPEWCLSHVQGIVRRVVPSVTGSIKTKQPT